MSHTTEITAIVFSDIDALRAAVKDLQASGVHCELVENTTARAYYPNQKGMSGIQDYVLRLRDSPYDVAFSYNKEAKGYTARTDYYAGHVEQILGVPPQKGDSAEQAGMGRLYQAYAVQAATRQAIKQGYPVRRVTKADGTIQLIMNVN